MLPMWTCLSRAECRETAKPRVLGCSDSVQSVLKLGDTDGDSLIDESEFRLLAAISSHRLKTSPLLMSDSFWFARCAHAQLGEKARPNGPSSQEAWFSFA